MSALSRRVRTAVVGLLGTTVVMGGVITSLAAPAAAATCQGYGCDGQNPYGSGCFTGSVVKDDRVLYNSIGQTDGAHVRLWYSPSCRTVWASMYNANVADGKAESTADIHRNSDNHQFNCDAWNGNGSCYTSMLYDAGTTSHAYGQSTPGTISGTESAYTINF